jgi:hypothetical protein
VAFSKMLFSRRCIALASVVTVVAFQHASSSVVTASHRIRHIVHHIVHHIMHRCRCISKCFLFSRAASRLNQLSLLFISTCFHVTPSCAASHHAHHASH